MAPLFDFLLPSGYTIGIHKLLKLLSWASLLVKDHFVKAMGCADLSSCICVGEEIIIMGAGIFLSVVTSCCVLNMQVSCLVALSASRLWTWHDTMCSLQNGSDCRVLFHLFQCSYGSMVGSHLTFSLRCVAISKRTAREDSICGNDWCSVVHENPKLRNMTNF